MSASGDWFFGDRSSGCLKILRWQETHVGTHLAVVPTCRHLYRKLHVGTGAGKKHVLVLQHIFEQNRHRPIVWALYPGVLT